MNNEAFSFGGNIMLVVVLAVDEATKSEEREIQQKGLICVEMYKKGV
jgi:hypothetical protein